LDAARFGLALEIRVFDDAVSEGQFERIQWRAAKVVIQPCLALNRVPFGSGAVTLLPNVADEMCVGYIAVVKKGQDLTTPRARDDLFEIFMRQRERLLRKQPTR
jgi:hypothetical protein